MILTLGLASALWIYLAAARAPGDSSGDDPTGSKQRWLGSLWHGRRLALTVACATVLGAGGFWLLADAPSDRAGRTG